MSAPTFTPEEIAAEEWRTVPGAPRYAVSNLGRVRGPRGLLRPMDNGFGYHQVQVARSGKGCRRLVHLLVLEAFAGLKPEGLEALHGPEGKACNALSNLRYGTHAENVAEHMADRRARPEAFRPLGRQTTPWYAAVQHLLGTMPDMQIAREHGLSQPALCELRHRLGIPAFRRKAA